MAANKSKKLIKNIGLNLLWMILWIIIFVIIEETLASMATDTSNAFFKPAGALFDLIGGNHLVWVGFPIVIGWVIISVKVWFPKVILTEQVKPDLSNADELKKYADLRDQGIITEVEFQAKKKKLLDL